MFLQKYQVKPMPLEEAVKLIQIAERARQGRLRAMFMKQIYLQEYRAKQARLLGDKVADVSAAALRIQKVWPWGTRWRCRPGVGLSARTQHSQVPPLAEEWQRQCPSLSRVQLCSPTDCSSPGSSVHGILQPRILEWVAISSSKGSSSLRDWTQVSCIAGKLFTVWATREAFSRTGLNSRKDCFILGKLLSMLGYVFFKLHYK